MQTKYHSEVKTVSFGGRMITVETRTPILPPHERAKRRREVEARLFDVLWKYRNDPQKRA